MRLPFRSEAYGRPFRRLAACLLLAFVLLPIAGRAEDLTEANVVLLIDVDADAILLAKGADTFIQPASLTKLMTAVIVFDEIRAGRLRLDDTAHISEHAWRHGGAPSRTWAMFAAVNSDVPIADLLRGLVVQSGNDAAIAFAEKIAGGEQAFAKLMNKRAKEIGMTRTVFQNPTGLPEPGQRTTGRDMAKLAQTIIEDYPEFFPMYGEQDFLWNRIRQRNRNRLVGDLAGVDGLGVGFSEDLGHNVVATINRDGRRLLLVLAGVKTERQRDEDVRKLFDWGYSAFEARPLFALGQTVANARVFGGTQGSVPLLADRAIAVLTPKGDNSAIVAKVVYSGPLHAPVAKGAPAGTLKVWRGSTLTMQVPLHTGEAVERGGLASRALDGAAELMRSGIAALFAKAGISGLMAKI